MSFIEFCHESSLITQIFKISSSGLSSRATQGACLRNLQDQPSLQGASGLIQFNIKFHGESRNPSKVKSGCLC